MESPDGRRRRDIVVLGASAGGVDALSDLVHQLPAKLNAALFVVLHVSPSGTSALPMILSRRGPLPAEHPQDGSAIERGRIYVAPPDRHLVLEDSRIRIIPGPKQNGHRPAIDPLFRSAARSFRERVVGVILSGTLDDGTLGLRAVKKLGGVALVQDPEEALYPSMPQSAIAHAGPDRVGSVADLAQLIVDLTSRVSENGGPTGGWVEDEAMEIELGPVYEDSRPGEVAAFTCPECGGALAEVHEGDLVRFRCHVGHSYSPGTLDAEQGDTVEAALWSALRALEERTALKRRLARRLEPASAPKRLASLGEQIKSGEEHARVLRQLLDEVATGPLLEPPAGEPDPSEVA